MALLPMAGLPIKRRANGALAPCVFTGLLLTVAGLTVYLFGTLAG